MLELLSIVVLMINGLLVYFLYEKSDVFFIVLVGSVLANMIFLLLAGRYNGRFFTRRLKSYWKSLLVLKVFVVIAYSVVVANEFLVAALIAVTATMYFAGEYVLMSRLKGVAGLKAPYVGHDSTYPEWARKIILDHRGAYVKNSLSVSKYLELVMFLPFVGLFTGSVSAFIFAIPSVIVFAAQILLSRKLGRLFRDIKNNGLARAVSFMNEYKPEVVLYFSGGKNSTYQLSMWIPVLEKMEKNVAIILRERSHFDSLDGSKIPILFVDKTRDLEEVVVSSVKVALYVANVGKNIQLLRDMTIKHVFIGHGDSDKSASAHNFMRAYDYMFVAGQAHIDRMRSVGLEMTQDYFIEVGRPQLDLSFKRDGG